jgi:hypothetical protein
LRDDVAEIGDRGPKIFPAPKMVPQWYLKRCQYWYLKWCHLLSKVVPKMVPYSRPTLVPKAVPYLVSPLRHTKPLPEVAVLPGRLFLDSVFGIECRSSARSL